MKAFLLLCFALLIYSIFSSFTEQECVEMFKECANNCVKYRGTSGSSYFGYCLDGCSSRFLDYCVGVARNETSAKNETS